MKIIRDGIVDKKKELTTQIVEVGAYTYIGKANIASSTSAAVWQVQRIEDG